MRRNARRAGRAVSCTTALAPGAADLALFIRFPGPGEAGLLFFPIKRASFGLLLPIFVTLSLPWVFVTRVTQGRSGRPLVLGHVGLCAFAVIHAIAVTRIPAEVLPARPAWHPISAGGGPVAFLRGCCARAGSA